MTTQIKLDKEQRDAIKAIFNERRAEHVERAKRLVVPFREVSGFVPVIFVEMEKLILEGYRVVSIDKQPIGIPGANITVLLDKPAEVLEQEYKEITTIAERDLQQKIIDEVSAVVAAKQKALADQEAAALAAEKAEQERLASDEDYQLRVALESVFK